MRSKSPGPVAFLLLLLVAVLMGAHHVAARVAFDHGADVDAVIVTRSLVTATAVGVLVFAHRVSWALSWHQWRVMALIGGLVWLQSSLVYSATARIPVAIALLAFNTYPIWTALCVWAIYRQRPSRRVLLAMPVIIFGLALALDVGSAFSGFGRPSSVSGVGMGVAAALGAGAIYGVVLSVMQHEVADIDGRLRTLLTVSVVAALSLAVSSSRGGIHWPQESAGWWGMALLSVCFGIGFTLLFSLLPKMGVVNNSPILNVEPVAVLILAWAVLGQRMAPLQLVGALLVVAAVVALGLLRRR